MLRNRTRLYICVPISARGLVLKMITRAINEGWLRYVDSNENEDRYRVNLMARRRRDAIGPAKRNQ